ncbi:unnamed protein product [Vitrella brassicaformis CCMP3155]|uniref:Uncharacterized protein n=2 Tax=Vitrella brassicaformis TaxID=1169539 RepID=A0A0G4EXH3_VITBC|nr:unnamed protein product [Vitrella brassicaformis CCMP3155]|mmetsp:Transcript_31348/g.77673  ORF Transcript_31348/g.77673 Transcript_31348/m.77673 type:complete len:156 (+) Transcript_31348:49-516(+)|eukprot:CEM03284.1 unnamed protein product [Vitrella brassicaformis CCMP3155]
MQDQYEYYHQLPPHLVHAVLPESSAPHDPAFEGLHPVPLPPQHDAKGWNAIVRFTTILGVQVVRHQAKRMEAAASIMALVVRRMHKEQQRAAFRKLLDHSRQGAFEAFKQRSEQILDKLDKLVESLSAHDFAKGELEEYVEKMIDQDAGYVLAEQ